MFPVLIGEHEVGGATGALIGTAGIAAAFAVVVLCLAIVLAVVYGLGFLFATIAAGLATAMSTWLAILIVTCGLFLVAAILGLIAVNRIQKGTPPIPEQAIQEAKLTTEAIKSNGD